MQKDLTKGSALKNIITFSLPFLLANLLQTFYGMADLFIVGQYNGAASLSGVSIGSQVMHMLTVMIVGLAMGSTVMIGRYVGERREQEKRQTIGNTIILFNHGYCFNGSSIIVYSTYYSCHVDTSRSNSRNKVLSYNLFFRYSFYCCL